MNNLSIRYKLLLSFLFMAFLIALSSFYSLYNLNYIKKNFINIVDNNVPRLQALLEMKNTSIQVSAFIHSFGDKKKSLSLEQVDNAKNELLAYLGNIDQLQKEYQSHLNHGEKSSLNIQELQKIRGTVIIDAIDIFSELASNVNEKLINERMDILNQSQARLNELIVDAVSIETLRLDKSKKNAMDITNQMYYFSLITDGLIFFVALTMSFVFIHIISNPIINLKNFANQISLDSLDQQIPIKSKDEIGQLAVSINSMLQHLSETRSELIALSREAGISEVATSILHNIGNVANSINISAFLIKKIITENNGKELQKIASLLHDNQNTMESFLKDDRGKNITLYLEKLSKKFNISHENLSKEIDELILHLQHIIDVIHMQQTLNKSGGIQENLIVSELIEEALSLHRKNITQDKIIIEKEYADLPKISSIKAKIQQILINLIKNAIESFPEDKKDEKKITLRTWQEDNKIYLTISDNGIGVEQENLIKIFMFGFTTKPNGHGYGLHHSANLAKELNGKLSVSSAGKNKGTTFKISFPII